MIAVIDANIALALVLDLAFSVKARAAVAQASAMIAPDLIVHETANALWKIGRTSPELRGKAVAMLRVIPALFEDMAPAAEHAASALNLALALDHPAYDCFYLALAEVRGATLITADRKLAAVAGRAHPAIPVHLVEA